jgi:hypothetical protein
MEEPKQMNIGDFLQEVGNKLKTQEGINAAQSKRIDRLERGLKAIEDELISIQEQLK